MDAVSQKLADVPVSKAQKAPGWDYLEIVVLRLRTTAECWGGVGRGTHRKRGCASSDKGQHDTLRYLAGYPRSWASVIRRLESYNTFTTFATACPCPFEDGVGMVVEAAKEAGLTDSQVSKRPVCMLCVILHIECPEPNQGLCGS